MRDTPDGRRIVEVRNAVPVPTVYDGAYHTPDPVAWHDLALRNVPGPGGQPHIVGWFYTDPALRAEPPRVDIAAAHRALAPEAGVLLLVDPTGEEGAFFVPDGGGFVRVEATRMKSDVVRLAVGVSGWPIAPWNSDFPGAASWLDAPPPPAPAWLDDPTAGSAGLPGFVPYMGPAAPEVVPPTLVEPPAPAPRAREEAARPPAPVEVKTPDEGVRAKLPPIVVLPAQVEHARERSKRDIAVLGLSAVLALVVIALNTPGLFRAEREARTVSQEPTALVGQALPASPTALITPLAEALGMEGPVEALPLPTATALSTEVPTPIPPQPDQPTPIPEPTPEPPPATEPPVEAAPPPPPPAAVPATSVPPRPVPPTATVRRAPRATATRRPPAATPRPPTATTASAAATVPVPADTPAPPPPPPNTPVPPTSAATAPPIATNTAVPPPPAPTSTPVPAPPTSTPAPLPPTSTPPPPPPPPDTPVPQPTSPPPPPTTTPPPPPPTDTPVPAPPTATNTPRPVVDATNTPRPVVDPTDTPTPPAAATPTGTP